MKSKLIKVVTSALLLATIIPIQTFAETKKSGVNLKNESEVYRYILDNKKDNLKLNLDGTIEITDLDALILEGSVKDKTKEYIKNVNFFVKNGSMKIGKDLIPYAITDGVQAPKQVEENLISSKLVSGGDIGTDGSDDGGGSGTSFDLNGHAWNNRQELRAYYYTVFESVVISNYSNPYPANPAIVATNSAGYYFAQRVKYGGIWDYKVPLGVNNVYPVTIGTTRFNLTGEQIGNIHYGYVGSQLFGAETLKYAAGMAQVVNNFKEGSLDFSVLNSYYDNPNDTPEIQRGIDWYNTGTLR